MIPKFFKWLLGEHLASSLSSILVGAAMVAGAAAASGDIDTKSLMTAAAVGAGTTITGMVGRRYGEK